LEDLEVDGRMTFIWIFKKYDGMVWNGLIWLSKETNGGLL